MQITLHVLITQNALRQKEAELKQANAELEERGKLLYKTKVCSMLQTQVLLNTDGSYTTLYPDHISSSGIMFVLQTEIHFTSYLSRAWTDPPGLFDWQLVMDEYVVMRTACTDIRTQCSKHHVQFRQSGSSPKHTLQNVCRQTSTDQYTVMNSSPRSAQLSSLPLVHTVHTASSAAWSYRGAQLAQ
jgi:hypothetical protein